MKLLTALLLTLFINPMFGQSEIELTPQGFAPISIQKPAKTNQKIIEAAQSWAASYNVGNEFPFDVYDVTETSFRIDAHRPNAFFYRNRGEAYFHRVKYTIDVALAENSYVVTFSIKEIYTSNRLTEMTLGDLFTPDGKLKSDYLDAKPSLEKSVNGIVRSFATYVQEY